MPISIFPNPPTIQQTYDTLCNINLYRIGYPFFYVIQLFIILIIKTINYLKLIPRSSISNTLYTRYMHKSKIILAKHKYLKQAQQNSNQLNVPLLVIVSNEQNKQSLHNLQRLLGSDLADYINSYFLVWCLAGSQQNQQSISTQTISSSTISSQSISMDFYKKSMKYEHILIKNVQQMEIQKITSNLQQIRNRYYQQQIINGSQIDDQTTWEPRIINTNKNTNKNREQSRNQQNTLIQIRYVNLCMVFNNKMIQLIWNRNNRIIIDYQILITGY